MQRLQNIAKKIFGTQNERELKSINPIVARINQIEPSIKPLSDAQLKAKTAEFKQRLANGETLDAILPEAFAVVREAAWRTIGQRHYDVQMIGGVTLHRGRIAEMRTGEGKTLVATLPCYLNALTGKGVHVITVNDYLARRDASWMGQVHNFLGLSTGIIVHGLNDVQRQQNYGCDITYGTNNEFGFDYLRDNMKFRLEDYVQRELNFAIVDEVDSILIDEARTPLIISGPTEDSTDLYYKIDRQIIADGGLIKEADYTIDEKSKTASLSEAGVEKMEKRLGIANLYDPSNIEVLHHVNQALRAQVLFKRDVDYVVKDGEVLIVDEFTGRLMPGRRWSDGLHQAIEAKEGVTIENENQTLATITFQNYFRMYNKLSGMTGTADTEATEFRQIYKLDVTVIPTNREMIRADHADVIFKSEASKLKAITADIKRVQEKNQPVLVGTVSVEKSEKLSALLKREGIKHHVLNAKHHEREADIVAQAGRKGSVTIATNMAGRGTDILLGGNPEALAKAEVGSVQSDATPEEKAEHEKAHVEALAKWKEKCAKEHDDVIASGGLFILGTERHESRRIDNQLRGRAGRQGDPGESRFYLSLDDDLMRIFGSVNIGRFMEEDMPIEHRWITKAIENAQRKVEGHNYDIRKHLLEYDDVMNQQRKVVYAWRKEVLARDDLRDMVFSMVNELAGAIAEDFFPGGKLKRTNGQAMLNVKELNDAVKVTLQFPSAIEERDIDPFNDKGLKALIVKLAERAYSEKERALGTETVRQIEKMILLTTIDHLWKDHLLAMDHLREGIGLQGYGQKDPLIEYKKQGFRFFSMMMNQITGDVVRKLFAVQMAPAEAELEEEFDLSSPSMQYNLSDDGTLIPQAPAPRAQQPQPASLPFAMPNRAPRQMTMTRGPIGGGLAGGAQPNQMSAAPQPVGVVGGVDKVGRNEPCPCGSGKKYKKCHGA
ncbi:MAG: preprotein translocase subunit SecA [Bdellovibrionales bacterium RIFOXYD1_FULL_55_31]|nr:MAG: preprotein translocase subunit SecA [Bdellovibrionales bacterium RIFOXYD1_FULL_55_31]